MDFAGYAWLARQYGAAAVQPLPSRAVIGTVRARRQDPDGIVEIFPAVMRPSPNLRAHLTFALKHEGVHLEALARLFAVVDARELEDWFASEPFGQYARRSCFLYEWLTREELDIRASVGGNYVEALDPDLCLVNPRPANVPRWRVRDNLLGTHAFSPTVRWTQRTRQAEAYDCSRHIQKIRAQFGEIALSSSSLSIALEECAYSMAMAGQGGAQPQRVRDMASVVMARSGLGQAPLSAEALAGLQEELLSAPSTVARGLRNAPAYVGDGLSPEGLAYVAPPWTAVPSMLAGLAAFEAMTARQSSILRAAVVSFGFAFIRPLDDGNGRISRFLINDVLRRDAAIPAPLVVPVSTRLSDARMLPISADQALQRYQAAWMARFRDTCAVEAGELHCSAYAEAQPTWSYPDLTVQAECLAVAVSEAIEREMPRIVAARRQELDLRAAIQQALGGTDDLVDRLIEEVLADGWVSQDVLEHLPELQDEALAERVAQMIAESGLPGSEVLQRGVGSRPRG